MTACEECCWQIHSVNSGRLTALCGRNSKPVAMERRSDGECGPDGKFFRGADK